MAAFFYSSAKNENK